MKVYLFRHGQTPGNAAHRYLGITDEPLSELGMETARKAGCDPTVSKVLVSPLKRTQMTAAILFPNAKQRVCDSFREMDFGDFEGRSAEEMANDPDYRRWVEETECMARASALPSRSHPEEIKGACSVAAAIFLARKGKRAEEIRDHIQRAYGYDMERHLRDMAIRASTPHARARFRRPLSAPLRRQAPKKPSGPPYSCATMRTRRAPLPDP